MSPPARDRALRRLAADLASLHSDDLASIVAGLSADERDAIDRLLAEYGAYAKPPACAANTRAQFDITRVSPWLVRVADGADDKQAVTAHLRHELEECLMLLFPLPGVTAQANGGRDVASGRRK